MYTAIFPGSFDPFTLGHMDILNSALKLFDKVVIAIGYNVQKKGLFSVDESISMIQDALKTWIMSRLYPTQDFTVTFCRQLGISS